MTWKRWVGGLIIQLRREETTGRDDGGFGFGCECEFGAAAAALGSGLWLVVTLCVTRF